MVLELRAQEGLLHPPLATLLVCAWRDSLNSLHSLVKIPHDGSRKAVPHYGFIPWEPKVVQKTNTLNCTCFIEKQIGNCHKRDT